MACSYSMLQLDGTFMPRYAGMQRIHKVRQGAHDRTEGDDVARGCDGFRSGLDRIAALRAGRFCCEACCSGGAAKIGRACPAIPVRC